MLTEMKNIGSHPAELRRLLQGAAASWNRLPAEERKPGAVQVGAVAFDPGFHRPVPTGALVLRQYQRGLRRGEDGKLSSHDFKFHEAPVWAQRDRAWILESEWKALVPAKPAAGAAGDVPASLKNRLIRYHFVEALVGEPGTWTPAQILSAPLKLTVQSVSESSIRFHLEGPVLLATGLDPATAKCGLDGNLVGVLNF